MKFIHAADIHLDSPLLNLNRYDGAPVEAFRSATRKAFENLVELAVDENVDFVLIAGDLYDGECKDMQTPLAFGRCLRELTRNEIGVYIVQGNHDAQSKVTKALAAELPEGVRLLSTRKPETILLDDLKVAIHGQGFSTTAVEHDLSARYPDAVPHFFNIGLLHTNCGGTPGHDNYAPSTVPLLSAKNYDYWALGHIHKRVNLSEGHPWIVYPGNIQGRNIRETGEKGCVVVSVEDGEVTDVTFRPVDLLRWGRLEIDASTCSDASKVVDAVVQAVAGCLESIGDRSLATRVEVSGASEAHHELVKHPGHYDQEIRDAVVNRFPDQVWVEKIRFSTRMPVDLEKAVLGDDALSGLLNDLADGDLVAGAFADVQAEFDALRAAIPSDPRQTSTLPDLSDAETRGRLLDEVKQLLIPRLLEAGAAK